MGNRLSGKRSVQDVPEITRNALERAALWRRVERAHATGRYSDAQLAERFSREGVTVDRLRRERTRARKLDVASWAVDLTGDVKRASAAILAQQAMIAEGGTADAVMAAARQVAGVLSQHRQDAGSARALMMDLMNELRAATLRPEALDSLFQGIESELEGAELAAFRSQVREFMRLHSRVSSMFKLAQTMQTVQRQERQAFGVADDHRPADNLDALSTEQLQARLDMLNAEIADLQQKAGRVPLILVMLSKAA